MYLLMGMTVDVRRFRMKREFCWGVKDLFSVLIRCCMFNMQVLLCAECIFLLPPCQWTIIFASQDGCCICTKSNLYKMPWLQAKAQFTEGIYFAPLNIFRKSLSSPCSLWDRQQPKLLSGTASLESCAACFVDNLQAFLRKAELTCA